MKGDEIHRGEVAAVGDAGRCAAWVTAWRSEEDGEALHGEVVGASNVCLFHGGGELAARGRVVVIVTGAEAAVRQRHAREVLADVLQP